MRKATALPFLSSSHHLAESDPGGVIDTDMDELPAFAAALVRTTPVAADAVADAIKSAELFDVDVDQFAGMFALVAAHR